MTNIFIVAFTLLKLLTKVMETQIEDRSNLSQTANGNLGVMELRTFIIKKLEKLLISKACCPKDIEYRKSFPLDLHLLRPNIRLILVMILVKTSGIHHGNPPVTKPAEGDLE